MTTTCKMYEIGRSGKMIPIDESAGKGLPIGTVLRWGGNMGWSARDLVILEERTPAQGGGYWCFDRAEREKNERLHFVEYHSIKKKDDPALWHSQHMFLTSEIVSAEMLEAMQEDHRQQAEALKTRQDTAKNEADKLEAKGRELWPKLIPTRTTHLIVAECMQDDSDIQTDYFASHAIKSVILAASKCKRDNFAEMRKAALKIPETRHLGPGCGDWKVMIKADPASGREWNGRLSDNEGRERWTTEAEARAVLAQAEAEEKAKNEAIPFVAFCPQLPYGADVQDDGIEQREKYSGGSGYYLQVNGCHASGWRVKKEGALAYGSTTPSRETLIMLARRHDHLTA